MLGYVEVVVRVLTEFSSCFPLDVAIWRKVSLARKLSGKRSRRSDVQRRFSGLEFSPVRCRSAATPIG